jgi:hypothetical protein
MEASPLSQFRVSHPVAYNQLKGAGLSPVTDDLMGVVLLESMPSAFVRVEEVEGGFLLNGFLLDGTEFFDKVAGDGVSPETVCAELVSMLEGLALEAYLSGQRGPVT